MVSSVSRTRSQVGLLERKRGVARKQRSGQGRRATSRPSKSVRISSVKSSSMPRITGRVSDIAMQFGLPLGKHRSTLIQPTSLSLKPGQLMVILGASGSGKTTALGEIARRVAVGCVVDRARFPKDTAVIDAVAPWGTLEEATALLTICGLGEARLWLRPYGELSAGEQFRARLAKSLALHRRSANIMPLLCDEFATHLHRRSAKSISYNLRKLVTRNTMTLVLACNNEDVLTDLRPDVIVRLRGGGETTVQAQTLPAKRWPSIRRRLHIERGCVRDYDTFASMHYRQSDELGFVDKIFVMRDGKDGEPVGIVVYAMSALELSLRNRLTDGWFTRNPKRVNRHLRILRRLVIHPDLRGCGLGHDLVRKTLPLVGTACVECLASMGEFNPVFEKAGMKRIGQYALSPKRQAAQVALGELGADPNRHDFTRQVARRRSVRRIVADIVYDWYVHTTTQAQVRMRRQSTQSLAHTFRSLIACRPVYYFWQKNSANRVSLKLKTFAKNRK